MRQLLSFVRTQARRLLGRATSFGPGAPRTLASDDIRAQLAASGVTFQGRVTFYGEPMLHMAPGSRIEIGPDVVLCSDSRFTALALNHPIKLSTLRPGAEIRIGESSGISGGTFIAARSITIGREVLVGANVCIFDTDFHPTAALNRRHSDDVDKIGVAPVVIGDNVFIGTQSIILKGTRIGEGCVVGAGSVVHGTFPDRVILAGNPAKIIGTVPDS